MPLSITLTSVLFVMRATAAATDVLPLPGLPCSTIVSLHFMPRSEYRASDSWNLSTAALTSRAAGISRVSKRDEDLLSIRDDLAAAVQKALYLFTLS